MTDMLIVPQVGDPELDEGQPEVAHIVKVQPGENAAAAVTEARVMGTPVEALCGFVWVPSKDPKRLPVCEACKEIYEMYRAANEGLGPQDNLPS